MSDFIYTCDHAQKALVELVELLKEASVLQTAPDSEMLRQCVESCDPCRHGHKAKRCRGWHTVIEREVLSFGPLTYGGNRQIRLDLSANCNYQRAKAGRQPAWDRAPLAASVVTIEIFEVATEVLLERHHLDLANPAPTGKPGQAGQPGPVWHLQMGGNPAGAVAATPTGWLDLPRWPVAPMDLTLAIEFLTYSFFLDKWTELNGHGAWLRLILGAEQLVVSHFAEHMAKHFQRDANKRDQTWLTAQDNRSEAFDPRPSSNP